MNISFSIPKPRIVIENMIFYLDSISFLECKNPQFLSYTTTYLLTHRAPSDSRITEKSAYVFPYSVIFSWKLWILRRWQESYFHCWISISLFHLVFRKIFPSFLVFFSFIFFITHSILTGVSFSSPFPKAVNKDLLHSITSLK